MAAYERCEHCDHCDHVLLWADGRLRCPRKSCPTTACENADGEAARARAGTHEPAERGAER